MDTIAVYRMFGPEGEALYVGSSVDPWARMQRHVRRTDLPADPARVEISYHDTYEEGLAVERAEIDRLRPALNVRGITYIDGVAKGDRVESVLAAMRQLGRPTTSQELSEILGYRCWTQVRRLRESGRLVSLGKADGQYRNGRRTKKCFIVALPEHAEAAA